MRLIAPHVTDIPYAAIIIATALSLIGCGATNTAPSASAVCAMPSKAATLWRGAPVAAQRDEAATIATRVADESGISPGYLMSDGHRVGRDDGWIFYASWTEDRTVGAHFFVFVFDDGTTRLDMGY